MARPKSEDRRRAILAATIELVATDGLGAATADIAKRASVPHGSIFTYFATKSDLLNEAYLELNADLTGAVLARMPERDPQIDQLRSAWMAWTGWGVSNLAGRRALAQLSVSDLVTEASRKTAYDAARPVIDVINGVRAGGALAKAPANYVGALVEALANSTIDAMCAMPEEMMVVQAIGFEALSNMLRR